jgi:aminocarboxymuconate-semialdehyde decarboxylase
MSNIRIDVHQHVVPPFWAAALERNGGDASGTVVPAWSPDSALAFMDANRIATGILSLTAPSVVGWQDVERQSMARQVNEYVADLGVRHAGRFGSFATVPLPDVDGALSEVAYAFDTLHADGVILLSNYGGRYLGSPEFEPLWRELDRRRSVVFIHPAQPPMSRAEGVNGALVDYPFDTTRTAVQLVLSGVTERHPNVRIILSHAGGFIPYVSHRVAELASYFDSDAPAAEGMLDSFRRFYFDLALSSSPAALPTLLAFAGSDHVLFGSDYPYAPAPISTRFAKAFDAFEGISQDQRDAIDRRNAKALLGRE